MTYQPSRRGGPYILGKIDTAVAVTPTEQNIPLDVFYTSFGQLSTSPTVSGLAFSDCTTGQYSGFSPYSQQSPQASGGFGSDIPRALGSRACGGSLGCAIYSNTVPVLRHKAYDTDEVLIDCHVVILGGT
jgi:hypothetical protein